ncbi:MAG TPA: hypothetical protein VFU29_23270 [Chitinophagaceae bacterium]|nr:hypothetical protein [Chitinophagaceae bacterium]
MYRLSEEQINYIGADIKKRGIEMESLQQDLLDHICCMIEEGLEENGDFEKFYAAVIKTFYKNELSEIETETVNLLTNKNYYTMKKAMIFSGIFSAIVLSLGILLKFLHAPGANVCIVTGIFFFSFIFLPLMSAMRMKEKEKTRDKLIIGLGVFPAILMSISFVFRVQHWPGAMMMLYGSIAILVLLFLPFYLVNGLRRPEARVNTIVTSVLVITICGLWLTIVASPAADKKRDAENTATYLRNEEILQTEKKQVEQYTKANSINEASLALSRKIYIGCEELKSLIIEYETGFKTIDADFKNGNIRLTDKWLPNYMANLPDAANKLNELKTLVMQYNDSNAAYPDKEIHIIPIQSTVLDRSEERSIGALNSFIQIQMYVLQNERELTAVKMSEL